VSVDCLVLLPKSRVLIGACSDRYLRFWDAETFHVLCSCLYLDVFETAASSSSTADAPAAAAAAAVGGGHSFNPNNNNYYSNSTSTRPTKQHVTAGDSLRLLQVSDSEDVLVGGYESGTLRVWSVQAYSLVTLQNLLQKHLQFHTLPAYLQQQQPSSSAPTTANFNIHSNASNSSSSSGGSAEFGEGMALAIAPLSLRSEWSAHDCPILSLEYVWFNYEESNFNNSFNPPATAAEKAKPTSMAMTRERREKQSDMGTDVLDGYVVSAGLDQKVFLWTLTGKCVGEFGGYSWDMNREASWLCTRQANLMTMLLLSSSSSSSSSASSAARRFHKKHPHAHSGSGGGQGSGGKQGGGIGGGLAGGSGGSGGDADYQRDKQRLHQQLLHQYSSSSSSAQQQQSFHPRHITQESLSMRASPSTQFLRQFCIESISGHKEHSSGEIGQYLDVLGKKHQHKTAKYMSLDVQFKEIAQTHPVIEPVLPRKEDFQQLQKKLGIVGV
jgi:hypothetical protein